MFHKKQKILTPAQQEEARTKDFFDCILPGVIRFHTDNYIVGDSYRCVWAIKGHNRPQSPARSSQGRPDRNRAALPKEQRQKQFII